MFAKFNLKLDSINSKLSDSFEKYGRALYSEQKKIVHKSLEEYIFPDGMLDAEKIEGDWFPSVDAHVFLSHSHQDEKAVLCLAGFLYCSYRIKCFIDSTVWGYANDLLKQIDEKYCVKNREDGTTYSYEKRNQSTAHVHMLLQGALAKMINRCECLVFVNTPNSLSARDIGKESKTSSPWIYSELLMANTFPARDPEYYDILKFSRRDEQLGHSDLKVNYRVKL